MMNPLVSVVIPAYNMEPWLAETLDSVLQSDYPDFEVILMDDGSTDGTVRIAQEYALYHPNLRVYTQSNAGVCAARNAAVQHAQGTYIFPLDADDRISPSFLGHAVSTLQADPEVKVVYSRAEYFGDRTGEWQLKPYSLQLLARKNMIPISAMYRKADWERVGGYCREIIAREDWEFWVSVLKDGGKVVQLPEVGLYYRIRHGSKRVSDRKLKRHVIDVMNQRHADFFQRQLGGPLHYNRSWSRWLNKLHRFLHPRRVEVHPQYREVMPFLQALPTLFPAQGETIYQGRNELKRFTYQGHTLIVKKYGRPHLINRLAYRLVRQSKACRAYRYGCHLQRLGIGTPQPIGFYSTGTWLTVDESYSVTLQSACPYTYRHFSTRSFQRMDDILRSIGRTAAMLHEHNMLHKDFSAGNILFDDAPQSIPVEIIDLNRMHFGPVSMEKGCRNFERLPVTEHMLYVLAEEYARCRQLDADTCFRLMCEHASWIKAEN